MGSKNTKQDITEKQKQILTVLALEGPACGYDLFKKKKIASNKTVYEARDHLISLGLIEIKREQPQEDTHESTYVMGRKKVYFGLTFHGVLYCLNVDLFEEKQAASVRLRNFAEIPVAVQTIPFGSLEEWMPASMRGEIERLNALLEVHLKPIMESCNANLQRIVKKARENNRYVRLLSMIEERHGERIYRALRAVNPTPGHYIEDYAADIFQKEYNACLNAFFFQMLKSNSEVFDDMQKCLKDQYSVDVLQKVLCVQWASAYQKLLRLESNSPADLLKGWTYLAKVFSDLSKMESDAFRSMLKGAPQAFSQVKQIMNRL
jgi:hypothetical protein